MGRIVDRFASALDAELKSWMRRDAFIDIQRLQGGQFVSEEIARSLCSSLCMVMLYTPTYFDEEFPYCTREFAAMEALETRRLLKLGSGNLRTHGLIIPVVIRGTPYLPDYIQTNRVYHDLSAISNTKKHPKEESIILQIAEYIHDRFREFEQKNINPCTECADFRLPSNDDVRSYWEKSNRQQPFSPFRSMF